MGTRKDRQISSQTHYPHMAKICFVFASQTNAAFVLKMSLFQFGLSWKTRKENVIENAEAGPLGKEKRLQEV